MADTIYTKTYACTLCGAVQPSRDRLTVKKASFHSMGSKAKTIRSRVMHWLCPTCLKNDPDWNREPYSEPGVVAEPIAPVDGQLTIPNG